MSDLEPLIQKPDDEFQTPTFTKGAVGAGAEAIIQSVENQLSSGLAPIRDARMKSVAWFQLAQAFPVKLLGDMETVALDFVAKRDAAYLRLKPYEENSKEAAEALKEFRRQHPSTAIRPAKDPWPVWATALFIGGLFVAESLLNGYFFAWGNEKGLLGGISVAAMVAILNIGVGTVSGWFARYIFWPTWWKLAGLVSMALGAVLAIGFNLGVGHFRDELTESKIHSTVDGGATWSKVAQADVTWEDISKAALSSIQNNPWHLEASETWLLFAVGVGAFAVSFWKGWTLVDPYPGYSKAFWSEVEGNIALNEETLSEKEGFENSVHEAIHDLDKNMAIISKNMAEVHTNLGPDGKFQIAIRQTEASAGKNLKAMLDMEYDVSGVSQSNRKYPTIDASDDIKFDRGDIKSLLKRVGEATKAVKGELLSLRFGKGK